MTGIRKISRATGALFEVERLQSLDADNCNLLLVSDRSLYLLQQFALNEVNWLARYVEEYLPPGYYLPVDDLSDDADFCRSVARQYRIEVNDMSCDVVAALDAINVNLAEMAAASAAAAACSSTGGGVGEPPPLTTEDVTIGPDGQFPTQSAYFEAKCVAANALFDTVEGMVDWMDSNGVDVILGVFGGVTSGIVAGALVAGPVGWGIVLGASIVASLAAFLIREALDFGDIGAALGDTHEACVKALYNANDASAASVAMVSAMAASGSYSTTAAEQAFVGMLLNQNLTNQLFNPRADTLTYVSPDPIDCTDDVTAWSFEASGEGFSFSDESVSPSSASGAWNSGVEGWIISLVTATSPAGPRATGRITKTGLSINVTTSNSVQMDFGLVSDNINIGHRITVNYSDASDQTISKSQKGAGTVILNCDGTKTINSIELDITRSYDYQPSTPTCDILEARVQ